MEKLYLDLFWGGDGEMTEKMVKVLNRAGVHARPAALVVQAIKDFKANIYIERGNEKINAKSIMGVITLGAAYGTELKIVAEGEDEQQAVDVLAHLFESRFEED
jgi:phosphocarrier protein